MAAAGVTAMALVASAVDATASFSMPGVGMCSQPFYNPAFVFTAVVQSRSLPLQQYQQSSSDLSRDLSFSATIPAVRPPTMRPWSACCNSTLRRKKGAAVMLQNSPGMNPTCEQVLDTRVAMKGESTAAQQQRKKRGGCGVPIDKQGWVSSGNPRTPDALAQHARARSASPAWLSVTEAFGCDEEMAKRLIEFGAFYRQKRADKPRRITDPSATVEAGEYMRIFLDPKRFPKFDEGVDLEERVVLETEDIMLVNKPAGVPCHPTVDNAWQNLLSTLRKARPGLELLLPHRLDADTSGLVIVAKNRRVLNAINEAMRRPVETLALFQQNDTGDDVPQPPDGIASNQGEEEAVDIHGGYTSSTSPGAVAGGTQRRTAGIRKRYRVLVEVLPGYPPLRPGLLTHYIRKTTWAPKEFRRKPHSATTCTDRPSLVPPDEKISDTDLTHMTTTTTTTADESVAPSGYPNTDDSAQRAFLVDGVNQRDLGVGEDVPVGRELAVTLEHEQEQRLGVMAAATAVPAAGNEESEAAATAAAASPQWNVCRLIVQSVTSAVLPVSAAVVPSLRCSHPPPSSSSPRPASSDTVQEVSFASTGAGAGTGAGGGAGAAQHVVLRDEVAEVANAIEDELASRDERDSGLVSETWDGQRPLRERRFQEVQVELVTGRPHQIRGQLAAEGCPIVGDKLYRRLQDKSDDYAATDGCIPRTRGPQLRHRRPFTPPKAGHVPPSDGYTNAGREGEERGIAGGVREGWRSADPHAATRSPGYYADSPRLALQAFELRLEVEGRLYTARLPFCWWRREEKSQEVERR